MTTQEPAVDGRASCVSVGVAAVSDRSQRLPAHALADDRRGQLVGSPAARGRISRGRMPCPRWCVRPVGRAPTRPAQPPGVGTCTGVGRGVDLQVQRELGTDVTYGLVRPRPRA